MLVRCRSGLKPRTEPSTPYSGSVLLSYGLSWRCRGRPGAAGDMPVCERRVVGCACGRTAHGRCGRAARRAFAPAHAPRQGRRCAAPKARAAAACAGARRARAEPSRVPGQSSIPAPWPSGPSRIGGSSPICGRWLLSAVGLSGPSPSVVPPRAFGAPHLRAVDSESRRWHSGKRRGAPSPDTRASTEYACRRGIADIVIGQSLVLSLSNHWYCHRAITDVVIEQSLILSPSNR